MWRLHYIGKTSLDLSENGAASISRMLGNVGRGGGRNLSCEMGSYWGHQAAAPWNSWFRLWCELAIYCYQCPMSLPDQYQEDRKLHNNHVHFQVIQQPLDSMNWLLYSTNLSTLCISPLTVSPVINEEEEPADNGSNIKYHILICQYNTMAERVFLFLRGAEQQPSWGHKDNYTMVLQFLPAGGSKSFDEHYLYLLSLPLWGRFQYRMLCPEYQ